MLLNNKILLLNKKQTKQIFRMSKKYAKIISVNKFEIYFLHVLINIFLIQLFMNLNFSF